MGLESVSASEDVIGDLDKGQHTSNKGQFTRISPKEATVFMSKY